MPRTATFLGLMVVALACAVIAAPAQAQRVFVSGSGLDTNPCTFPAPCRTFQQAFNTVAAGGEIDVLDPAGYGPLAINHGISIQAHGFGGITQTSSTIGAAAITISAGASDAVTLNGLLIDGAGSGYYGIVINAGGSVQILNCVVRHFKYGIYYQPSNSPAANLLVADTVASDNMDGIDTHLDLEEGNPLVTLSRITANDNQNGLRLLFGLVMIADSVVSNNSAAGVRVDQGSTWLARTAISGNATGVFNAGGGTIYSYGDNDINSNVTDLDGPLTSASTQ